MSELRRLAWEIGADERTLRRAVAAGTLRCWRPSPRRLMVDEGERAYLRRHWDTLAELRALLRTEPNVRFAALFGSLARGDEHEGSDADLLVEFDKRDRGGMLRLQGKLEHLLGRPVELMHFTDAQRSPRLLEDVVRDGRVLVDRSGRWPRLQARRRQILQAAREADAETLAAEREAMSYFKREAAAVLWP